MLSVKVNGLLLLISDFYRSRIVMENKNQTNRVFIELHVPDFDIAKDFYSKLGFQVVSDDGLVDGVGYFVMERNGTMINFYGGSDKVYGQSYFKKFPKNTARGFEVELTIPIPVEEIDRYFTEVKSNVPENVVQDLIVKKDRSLTWRDFRVADPFGFYLRFTEPIDWFACHCRSGKNWKNCHGKQD